MLEYSNSMYLMPDLYSNQEDYTYSQSIYRYLKQAGDCDEDYVVSASSTSSGSRRRSYRLRTRKEKQVSSNQEPLKHAHPTEWFIMKRKKWRVSCEGKVPRTRPI